MVSTFVLTLLSLIPIFFFLSAFVIVYLIGGKKTHEAFGERTTLLTQELEQVGFVPAKEYMETPERKRIAVHVDKMQKVNSASVWIDMWPRKSLIHVVTQPFFHPSDSFVLTLNMGTRNDLWPPSYILEIMPYTKKGYIRANFDYLIELDDIETGVEEIDKNYLIKSDRLRVFRAYFRNKKNIPNLKKVLDGIEYLTLRSAQPHLECKFKLRDGESTKTYLTFVLQLVSEFAKPISKKKGERAKKRKTVAKRA